ncbi:hypothetical protein [Streptomyces parvulus]|uniref:hypothetical protein n=1 Tax=Streptomyces parvulus TaxID=146923 RepID=UPI0036F77A40
MPRIQILPLPEGASDERPPVALVIDQAPRDENSAAFRDDIANNKIAERIGARHVLVFEDTIEIPANDVSAYATPTMNIRIDGSTDADSTELAENIRRGIEHANATPGSTR